ncbi:MAG: DUF2723 domain-containing protein [Myxococcales bacterium]|nr:DUF2723 domain-containing protein [Myxococcales bacterium]
MSAPADPPELPAWRSRLPLAGLAALLLGLAGLALPDAVQAGDAGEFATVMLEGGVPHPSGYPWMRILGLPARALLALGVPPTRAAAWPCALAGVAAWLLLWPVLVRWSGRGPATAAVAIMATASPVLLHASDSEVWGLHLLACAAILRLADRPGVRPYQLGLAFGLAVSHHLSAVLVLPVVVGAAWPRPFAPRRLLRAGLEGVAAGLLGLLPYLTLMIGRGGAWRWGDPTTLEGLVHHVSRADYGVFQLSLHQETPDLLDQWSRAIQTVGSAAGGGLPAGPVAATLVLLLVGVLALPRPAAARPGAWWGLWGAVLASTLVFPAVHNIDPTRPFGAWILERFDLLSILLWCPLWAAAASRLLGLARHRWARGLLGLGAAVLVVTQITRSTARGLPSDDGGVERYAVDLLRTPAPGQRALVFGTDDHRLFPVLFVQQVRGLGPEVLYIDASLLSQRWYRDQLRTRWPGLPEIDKPVAMMGALWSNPALRDTPIYLANVFSRPAAALPMVPQGVLLRVLPPHRLDTGPAEVIAGHLEALHRYGSPPRHQPRPAHPWTDDLFAAYHDGSRRLLDALHAEGREADANALLDALGPWRPHPP